MRVVLAGDSHLARIRREGHRLGPDVSNIAVGGASSVDLRAQVRGFDVRSSDRFVISVGSNDAAPWKSVPVDDFAAALGESLEALRPAHSVVFVAPPGVVEARLSRERDRTNGVIDTYREAASVVCGTADVHVLRTDLLLAPLGPVAFDPDGLHLSGAGYRRLLDELSSVVVDRAY